MSLHNVELKTLDEDGFRIGPTGCTIHHWRWFMSEALNAWEQRIRLENKPASYDLKLCADCYRLVYEWAMERERRYPPIGV